MATQRSAARWFPRILYAVATLPVLPVILALACVAALTGDLGAGLQD